MVIWYAYKKNFFELQLRVSIELDFYQVTTLGTFLGGGESAQLIHLFIDKSTVLQPLSSEGLRQRSK